MTLSATGPVNVGVWNDTGNVLLARRSVEECRGVHAQNHFALVNVEGFFRKRKGVQLALWISDFAKFESRRRFRS